MQSLQSNPTFNTLDHKDKSIYYICTELLNNPPKSKSTWEKLLKQIENNKTITKEELELYLLEIVEKYTEFVRELQEDKLYILKLINLLFEYLKIPSNKRIYYILKVILNLRDKLLISSKINIYFYISVIKMFLNHILNTKNFKSEDVRFVYYTVVERILFKENPEILFDIIDLFTKYINKTTLKNDNLNLLMIPIRFYMNIFKYKCGSETYKTKYLSLINFLLKREKQIETLNDEIILECSDSLYLHIFSKIFDEMSSSHDQFNFQGSLSLEEYDMGLILQYLKLVNINSIELECLLRNYILPILAVKHKEHCKTYCKIIKRLNTIKKNYTDKTMKELPKFKNQTNEQKIYSYITEFLNETQIHKIVQLYSQETPIPKRVELNNYDVLVFSFFQYVMENESNQELYLISYVIHLLTSKRVTLPEDYSDLLNFTIIKYAEKPCSFKKMIKIKLESSKKEVDKASKLYLDFGIDLYKTVDSLKQLENTEIRKFKFFLLGNFPEQMIIDIISNVFINLISRLYQLKYVTFVKSTIPILDFFNNVDVDNLQHVKLVSECINNIFMLFFQPIDTATSGSDFLNVADLVAEKLNSRSSVIHDIYLQRNSILIFLKKILTSFNLIRWAELNLKYKRYYWALYLAEMYVIHEKLLGHFDVSTYIFKEKYTQIRMVCEKKIFNRLLTDTTTTDNIETLRLEYKMKEEDGKYLQLWFSEQSPPIIKSYLYREYCEDIIASMDDVRSIHRLLANFIYMLGQERSKNHKFVSDNKIQLIYYIDRISEEWEKTQSTTSKKISLLNESFINSFLHTLKYKVSNNINRLYPVPDDYVSPISRVFSEDFNKIDGRNIHTIFQTVIEDLKTPIFDLLTESEFKNVDDKYKFLSRIDNKNLQLIIFYSKTFMKEGENRNIVSNISMIKILNNKLKIASEFLFNSFWSYTSKQDCVLESSTIFNMLVKACLLWNRREYGKAIEINFKTVALLKNIKNNDNINVKKFSAVSSTILAIRSFERQSINYEDCDELFKQSLNALPENDDKILYFVKKNYKVFISQLLNKKEKLFLSTEWLKKRDLVKQKKSMIETTRGKYNRISRSASSAEQKFYNVLNMATTELKNEIITLNKQTSKHEADKIRFTKLVCECIILEQDNSSQMAFELVNLWFENQYKTTSITSIIYKYISLEKPCIQSYKLIPVIKQLVSKLSTLNVPLKLGKKESFSTVLYNICLEVISSHPFQTIQLFIPLRNKNKHCEDLLNNLLMTKYGKYIKMYIQTADFYIELSEDKFIKKLENGKIVTMSFKMEELAKKLKGSILYTADVPINVDAIYDEESLLPYKIEAISKSIQTTPSGISRPLILNIKTAKGVSFKQLIKSNDDMRQDSCVQLLFKSLNRFIPFNQIRTYNAFPINSSVGVIEWLNDVISYCNYIETAHKVYTGKVNDLKICRDKMSKTTSKIKLLSNYKEILEKTRPMMRYFFLENFNTPKSYITARHNYLVSTAVASLVGYIVGVGDRHNENIMIDKSTAESVHIDFGVMFGQGEALKIPEQVPFRLTPEMNDGLGVLTINSGFKVYMEETLKSLKANKQIIMTVLKVLTNDPINRWVLSNKIIQEKVSKYRKIKLSFDTKQEFKFTTTSGDNLNINAEQMLSTVNDKLDGNVDFVHYNTSGLVNKLIVDATNHEFLSQMYFGWASWL